MIKKILATLALTVFAATSVFAYTNTGSSGTQPTQTGEWDFLSTNILKAKRSAVTQICQSDGTTCTTIGAGASGASTALDNLASVAINTSLVSDTADTDSLGSTTKEWLNAYIGDAGKLFFGLGQDATIHRSAANTLTLTASSGVVTSAGLTVGGTAAATTFDTNVAAAGVTLAGTTLAADGTDANIDITVTPKGSGDLALGTADLTMTGSLAATGARVTKGWFTDIESTNMPTVGGTAILTSLTAPQFTTIELGHATDTTLSRVSAGVVAVEGNNVLTTAAGTAVAAAAITSATTTVNTSSATAPSVGQVLTATSDSAATWQTPSGGGNKTIWAQIYSADGGVDGLGNEFSRGQVSDAFTMRARSQFILPSDFTSITSVKAYWTANVASGNLYSAFTSRAVNSGEVYSSGGSSDSIAVTTYAISGANEIQITDVTAMANGLTLSAGDIIGLAFERNGADASDTLGVAVFVLGFEVTYN